MAECSSSFISLHSEKEKIQILINGCIVKGVREKIASCEEYKKIELEELEAYLDPSFSPEGKTRSLVFFFVLQKASIRYPCNI